MLHLLQNGDGAKDPRAPGDGPSRGDRPAESGTGENSARAVTCAFCGQEFVEDRSQAVCQACPLSKACGLMRCPHCGYENAKQPGWITRIKEWLG